MAGLRRGREVIVDVHGHITHPELFKKYPMPPALADIEGMLDRKSEAGIGLTVVGSPVGFGTMTRMPGLDNYAQPLDQLKSFHEWLAETVAKHAPRLAAYAYTNPLGGDEILEQTVQTVRDGGFVGLIVNTASRASTSTPIGPTRSSRWPPSSACRSSSIRRPSPSGATASRTSAWSSRWAASWT